MGKREKPKLRGVWKINPKTRVQPNKKKNFDDYMCGNCNGIGEVRVVLNAKTSQFEECPFCEGTGLK